ncbi:MAG TPA: hypothetical protein VMW64_02080 [Dehalococcoidia bacterium]|nr:hypothetical protein [Dehalococcoidia bacterium]
MVTLPLKPSRGGFLRPFGCGWFIREFLLGNGPYGSPSIDPEVGAPQADICYHYKQALRRVTAEDRAVRQEEKSAKRAKRPINPENIEALTKKYLERLPYKSRGCRYHSFVNYFSTIQKLGWVEETGREEPSAFQEHYPPGPPRRYFRLTEKGKSAPDYLWADPRKALYS